MPFPVQIHHYSWGMEYTFSVCELRWKSCAVISSLVLHKINYYNYYKQALNILFLNQEWCFATFLYFWHEISDLLFRKGSPKWFESVAVSQCPQLFCLWRLRSEHLLQYSPGSPESGQSPFILYTDKFRKDVTICFSSLIKFPRRGALKHMDTCIWILIWIQCSWNSINNLQFPRHDCAAETCFLC